MHFINFKIASAAILEMYRQVGGVILDENGIIKKGAIIRHLINRRITRWEHDRVVNRFIKLGFRNGYIQDREAAKEDYIPDFNLEGIML